MSYSNIMSIYILDRKDPQISSKRQTQVDRRIQLSLYCQQENLIKE